MAEDFDVKDYAAMVTEMGKRFDSIDRSLGLQSQQLTEISKKFDEQEITLYEQGALLKGHSRELIAMNKRLDKIEGTMATKDELAALEARMNGKFDQVLGSFQQVLAILDERLPKQGE